MEKKEELTQFYRDLYKLLPNRYNNYYLENDIKVNDEVSTHKLYCDYCYNNFDLSQDKMHFVKRKDIKSLKLFKGSLKNDIKKYSVMKVKCSLCNKTSYKLLNKTMHSCKPKKNQAVTKKNDHLTINNVPTNFINNNNNKEKGKHMSDKELRSLLVKKMTEKSKSEEQLKQKEAQSNLLSFLKKLN